MIKAALFDLDGTLLDTLGDISDSLNAVLKSRGFPTHSVDAVRSFIGEGMRNLVKRVLPPDSPDALIDDILTTYMARYRNNWAVKTRAYDGIPELLDRIATRGLALAVLSNKPDVFTVPMIEHFFPGREFAAVLGASDRFPRKPDPASALHIAEVMSVAPAEVLYLGDSATDMETALAAGMIPIGAAWGFRTREDLLASGARAVYDHPLEVLAALDGRD